MSHPYLFYSPDKPIPMHQRLVYSDIQSSQPARSKDFDVLIRSDIYPLPLLYGESENAEYLYHDRISVVNGKPYHEVVWEAGREIILWDENFILPVGVATIESISFTRGHDDMYYLHIKVDEECLHRISIPHYRLAVMTLMRQFHPLWSARTWIEFVMSMNIEMAKKVNRILWSYANEDEDTPLIFRYKLSTIEVFKPFITVYANYPNEKYQLESSLHFIMNSLHDAIPRVGDWGWSPHITLFSDYDIRISTDHLYTTYEDGVEVESESVEIEIDLHRSPLNSRSYYWEPDKDIRFKWETEEEDFDTTYPEEFLWQELDANISPILVKKVEEL